MIDKRKMNIRYVLLFLFLCHTSWYISSCEQTVGVSDGSDPVLQVDAVIYNGRPLPVIKIKQSFEMSGKDPFYVDEEELYVSGADVVLTHNGEAVTVREVDPGKYQPESDQIVEMGDRVSIQVSFEGKTVSAQAEVPRYPVDEMVIQPSGIADINYITGGHWLYVMPVQAELPFTADFTALRVIAGNKDHQCWDYCRYSRYFGDQYSGAETLSLRKEIAVMVPRGEEEMEPPTGNVTIPMYVDLQIPEPIYVDYIRSYSDEFVTNTVTNVEGGVGLFIGAIQVEKEIQIEVELRSR
ncbi:MAG TPA: DUF4249 family protein [Balneolaceae bacterium]|nr:DUF4249 family protein [Balneolaceae bacterium]